MSRRQSQLVPLRHSLLSDTHSAEPLSRHQSLLIPKESITRSAARLSRLIRLGKADPIPRRIRTTVQVRELSHDSIGPQTCFQIKPGYQDVFKEEPVREMLRAVLSYSLSEKIYEAEKVKPLTIRMCNEINERLKDFGMQRYKHVVQVDIGEKRGQGVKCGIKCVWDPDTDSYISETFINDTIFCIATVFAIFLY